MSRRHAIWFATALVVPCAVFVVLGLRMIREGDEAARVRQTADRQAASGRAARALSTWLDRIALDEASAITTRSEPDAALAVPRHEQVVLLGWLRDGRIAWPWDVDPAPLRFGEALGTPSVARRLDLGLRQEAQGQLTEAERTFSALRRTTSDPIARDWATFLHARVLIKCDCPSEARDLLLPLLDSPHVDDLGVPIAFWASNQLLRVRVEEDGTRILESLAKRMADSPVWSPAAWYQARALIDALPEPASSDRALGEVRARVERGLDELEHATEVGRVWPDSAAAELPPDANERIWTTAATGRWLVGAAPAVGGLPPLVVVVDARAAEAAVSATDPSLSGLSLSTDPGIGQPLGSALPGLRVLVPDSDLMLRAWSRQRMYWIVALFAVIGIAVTGAVLFWRDVQRELRIADLRSQFVASVSHELRTPLTAIRMFAETLTMDRPLDARARAEYLNTIVTESERLTRLVNNVLDFSKIERGEKVYRLEPASLPAIVRSAAQAMRYPLTRQGFDLRVAIADSLPPVNVDQDAIEQAVLNLLSNAVKYSGDARTIGLSVGRENGHAVIAVSDHGLGVRPEDRARIFERFYRAGTTDVERIPGAGLGLAIVDHIVKAHGGRVEVTSEPGTGSTFAIHLPVEAAS